MKIMKGKNMGPILVTMLSAALFCTTALGVGAMRAHAKENEEPLILEGVYAGSIPLGGMSDKEARASIENYMAELSGRNITLYAVNDEEITVTPEELGFAWGNPDIVDDAISKGHKGNIVQRYKEKKDLQYTNRIYDIVRTVDDSKVRDILNTRCTAFDTNAADGLLTLVDGQFVIDAGQTGATLDVDASAKALEDFICNTWTGENTSFQLIINENDPEGTYEQLSLVKDLLGSYHTNFKSSGASRSANVANGAALINGDIIYPGEEYSFYNHIQPFTEENGYRMAAAYSAGKVVDSIGGGICQVSSTLYNAVLYAELEVTNRRNHAMIVGYVDPARDATISEASGIDFLFRNNTDAPIYIDAYTTDEKELYINLYGHETRPADRTVEYKSEVLEKKVPEGETIYTDASLPVGHVEVQSAHIGYKANLWKYVTVNGETTKELINTSSYTPVPKYATVGMATDDPNALALMQAAVSSGSIANCKAAAAECKAVAAAGATIAPDDPVALGLEAQRIEAEQAALLAAQQAALEQQMAAEQPAAE